MVKGLISLFLATLVIFSIGNTVFNAFSFAKDSMRDNQISRHMRVHVNMFENSTGKKVTGDVVFSHLGRSASGNKVIGRCSMFPTKVEIDADYWIGEKNQLQVESTVLHELMHCYCYSNHTKDKLIDECPSSFMYRSEIETDCLVKHRAIYLQDMKESCK